MTRIRQYVSLGEAKNFLASTSDTYSCFGGCVSINLYLVGHYRLLINWITMRQWHNHGEEVLANTLRILRGWDNTSDLRRRSRRRRRYCLNLEGWGGYSPIPPSHGYAIDIVLWGKINSSSWRVLINIPPSSRWVYIGQCTPLLPVGVHWSMYTHPDNSKIDFFSRRVYIGQCTPLLPKGVHWPFPCRKWKLSMTTRGRKIPYPIGFFKEKFFDNLF